jgi:hypothetical protein
MTLDWKHWLLTHLIYIVIIAALVLGFRSWRAEHDARLAAEKSIAVSQQQVKSLQDQITQRDAASAKQVQTIVKVVHDTATPLQAAQNLPLVVTTPLPAPVTVGANNGWLVPAVDVPNLFQQIADDKICRTELTTANADLVSEKAITVQLNGQITVLKKKPSFWHRVGSTMKKVGIGVGIGIAVAAVVH